jgi:hypothetical protein
MCKFLSYDVGFLHFHFKGNTGRLGTRFLGSEKQLSYTSVTSRRKAGYSVVLQPGQRTNREAKKFACGCVALLPKQAFDRRASTPS